MVYKKKPKEHGKGEKDKAAVPKSIVVLEKSPVKKKKKKPMKKKKKAAEVSETTAEAILGEVDSLKVGGRDEIVETIGVGLVEKLTMEDGGTGVDSGWDMAVVEGGGDGGAGSGGKVGGGGDGDKASGETEVSGVGEKGNDDDELMDFLLN